MQLFFSDNINNHFTLSSEESKHVIKVLRKKEGDIIHFTDGKGNLLVSEIITSHIKKTQVRIIEKISKEKNIIIIYILTYRPLKILIVLNGF